MRKLKCRTTFATQDIIRLIQENDLSDPNTFLVLNGGTGTGKTSSIMRQVQNELEIKLGKSQSLLVVESRTATVDQLNQNYNDCIEKMNGVDVCQRLAFMHKINRNEIHYDWVVIDECHGLFSEASFAEDAEFIANWIRNKRNGAHIIFVTANDEYFEELSLKYFPGNFNFIYLFPDFTHYVSHTYVKEIQFIKTNKVDDVISMILAKKKGLKGIIFLKKASGVKDWFFRMFNSGINVGMIVSQANETTAALTTYQEQLAKKAAIDLSNGQAGLTMADLTELFDTVRRQQGKEGIREAIAAERMPDDIDILLATDTIQEGISIKSHIDFIAIEGYTDVEVRQKMGRYRGNLELLYIIFNPSTARGQTIDKLKVFESLWDLYNKGNQTALAEFYGRQKASKLATKFVKKRINHETQEAIYTINEPAYLNCQNEFHLYTRLVNDTQATVLSTYNYPLLEGEPKILDYTSDIRNFNLEEKIKDIADKWRGIPLKGPAQQKLIQDFIDNEITNKNYKKIDTFKKVCNVLKEYNIPIKEKQASKKDLKDWPAYLSNAREKYKIII